MPVGFSEALHDVDGWMIDDLQFNFLFNSISVVSG